MCDDTVIHKLRLTSHETIVINVDMDQGHVVSMNGIFFRVEFFGDECDVNVFPYVGRFCNVTVNLSNIVCPIKYIIIQNLSEKDNIIQIICEKLDAGSILFKGLLQLSVTFFVLYWVFGCCLQAHR
jgi:hypothetical protein